MDTPLSHMPRKDVALWLFILAGAVALMVLVGGLTRLTDSGLSITEWQLVSGILPPLTHADWLVAFEKYKQIPEYRLVNQGMSLAQFQYIYWWEWGHRLLGRLVGAVFLLPLIIFVVRRRLVRGDLPPLLALFVLGAMQGALGWYMVQSGLGVSADTALVNAPVDAPVNVSHYRLAAHLGLALIIFIWSLWLALTYWYAAPPHPSRQRGGLGRSWLIVALVFLQSLLGALVAGLDAGTIYNDFPRMDGAWLPDNLFAPATGAVLADPLTLQFLHRTTAYVLFLLVLWHVLRLNRGWWLLAAIFVQIGLGVATLLLVVPLGLAAAHQIGAVAVLALAVGHLYHLRHFPPK